MDWEPPGLGPLDPAAVYFAVFGDYRAVGGSGNADGATGVVRRTATVVEDGPGVPVDEVFSVRLVWEHSTFFVDADHSRGLVLPCAQVGAAEAEVLVARLYERGLALWPPQSDSGLWLSADDNAAVQAFYGQAIRVANDVTPRMQALVAQVAPGAQLVGLDERVKFANALKTKVAAAMVTNPGWPVDRVLLAVDDPVRFTVVAPVESYTDTVRALVAGLGSDGSALVRFANYWGSDQYKGITSVWSGPDTGMLFEVQLHTPDSYVQQGSDLAGSMRQAKRMSGMSPGQALQTWQRNAMLYRSLPVPPGAGELSFQVSAAPVTGPVPLVSAPGERTAGPASTDGTVTLCSYRDDRVSITVLASVEQGCLVVRGQDIGEATKEFWGEDEYEYTLRFDAEATARLARHLGDDDLLARLVEGYSGHDGLKRLRETCDSAGIQYEFSTYL